MHLNSGVSSMDRIIEEPISNYKLDTVAQNRYNSNILGKFSKFIFLLSLPLIVYGLFKTDVFSYALLLFFASSILLFVHYYFISPRCSSCDKKCSRAHFIREPLSWETIHPFYTKVNGHHIMKDSEKGTQILTHSAFVCFSCKKFVSYHKNAHAEVSQDLLDKILRRPNQS